MLFKQICGNNLRNYTGESIYEMPPLRERVARYMWQYLKENNQHFENKVCPADMIAMLLEQMKAKLEKLVDDPSTA